MALINTTEIANGMVLAADVTNLEGRVLMREGLTLSTRHVTALKAWGVQRVRIRDAESPESDESADREATIVKTAEIEEELTEIFRHTDRGHPVIEGLYQQARNNRLRGAA